MSVPSYRRKPLVENLRAGLLAAELYVDTMRLLSNEKAIPRRYRWCCTDSVMDGMRTVMLDIVDANDMGLTAEGHMDRRRLQREAMFALRHCLMQLDAIADGLPESSARHLQTWLEKAVELERLLAAWARSDMRRVASRDFSPAQAELAAVLDAPSSVGPAEDDEVACVP